MQGLGELSVSRLLVVVLVLAVMTVVRAEGEESCAGDKEFRSTSRCICSPQVTISPGTVPVNISHNLLELILAQINSQSAQLKSQGQELKELKQKYSKLRKECESLNNNIYDTNKANFKQMQKMKKTIEEFQEKMADRKSCEKEKVHTPEEREKKRQEQKKEEKKKEEKIMEETKIENEEKESKKEIEKESKIARDCADVQLSGETMSGIYRITPEGATDSYDVFCDLDTDGGGWLVFQRRMDGRYGFKRSWEKFKRGFGRLDLEFWLGNDKVHNLTHQGAQELLVDMRRFSGDEAFAKYSNFRIGNEKTKYKIFLGEYTGTAGDGLIHHNTMPFSTYDSDSPMQCAETYGGGWWYTSCYDANLNGFYYYHERQKDGIVWPTWTNSHESLKHVEMKFRPTDFKARQGKK